MSGPITEPRADDRAALEDRARQQPDVGLELDGGVDVGAGGVDHRDALAHPPVVDARAQLGLGLGELGAVVDAERLGGVVGLDREHHVPGLPQHRDDVGEVVLALGVLGAEPPQRRREEPAAEAVDRRVDLVDRELLGIGVGLLDDAVDVGRWASRTMRP